MSVLISCRNLTHSAGTKPLFRDLSLSVSRGDKVGLNGHNGCGKSTLLKILAGSAHPDGIVVDEGEISRRQGLRLAMVEQFLPSAEASLTLEGARHLALRRGAHLHQAAPQGLLGALLLPQRGLDLVARDQALAHQQLPQQDVEGDLQVRVGRARNGRVRPLCSEPRVELPRGRRRRRRREQPAHQDGATPR